MKRILWLFFLLPQLALSKDLVVHEWGTFTSLMGSDGQRQAGMHHEEERLPNFVFGFHHPDQEGAHAKRCGKVPCSTLRALSSHQALDVKPANPLGAGITQKMETPVIYFYGDVGQKVNVDIDFPNGIISQYYPKAKSYTPSFDKISTLGPSRFSFEVTLLAQEDKKNLLSTTLNSIWNPSRLVQANTITDGINHEKFIFYRGVGDFDAHFRIENDGNTLILKNNSSYKVDHAFVLNFNGQLGTIEEIGTVLKEQSKKIPNNPHLSKNAYLLQAKNMIEKALIKDGLFADEARAMVNTWEKSYFETPGIRVLYLVPRGETDRIIPLRVNPAPTKLIRTLVGRIEIMSKNEENTVFNLLPDLSLNEAKKTLGHFYEPKLRRLWAMALAKHHPIADKIEGFLKQIN